MAQHLKFLAPFLHGPSERLNWNEVSKWTSVWLRERAKDILSVSLAVAGCLLCSVREREIYREVTGYIEHVHRTFCHKKF